MKSSSFSLSEMANFHKQEFYKEEDFPTLFALFFHPLPKKLWTKSKKEIDDYIIEQVKKLSVGQLKPNSDGFYSKVDIDSFIKSKV